MTPWRRVRALFPLPLFWRNFLTFWLCAAAIVGIGMALTAAVAWYRFDALDGLGPAALTEEAVEVASAQGRPGLRRWLWAMVTGPTRRLREATQALAAGELSARTPPALARRADELGQLARDFDVMADRVQHRMDWREQLLRNIAHELRSPLGRLRLSLELARRRDATLELQFERIERETERLDALVERTLQLARLHAVAPVRSAIDLAGLVDAVVADARFEAAARGVAIRWAPPHELLVDADAAALGSAIENILRNAVRYTDPAVPVTVALCANDESIRLDIVDGGPGVPEDALASLFEPFYRVRSGPGQPAGAGLGLSIAQAAIAAHGGMVVARNAAPRGLAVRVWLPRRALAVAGAVTEGLPA
ncbi:HAMP domain-containing sensor histidine kinase [Cupriavidus necator]|uniref:HAMP domain-containing sensor histidine kinase n=1 Tax=Cupriavidus necator TaxID=106590 RepID=UPI0005B4C3FF|nr:ATP-binding protein [Cupriavidus necator]